MPSAEDIVTFNETPPPPGATPWVGLAEPARDIAIVDPSPSWPQDFELLRDRIERALGERALAVEHVGSTSVPSLPAKPIIDIDLIVADSTDETAYVPALEAAGFTLRIREPWWYEHRCFAADDPKCNLHVWSPWSPEAVRHVMFREWLRAHPEDRALYRDAKVAAAAAANARGEHVMQYNERKQATIREIYGRAFAAAGLIG